VLHTVQKAGHILNLFSLDQPEWGVSEIAKLLGTSKSSISELLSTLAEYGLVNRTFEGRYRLGWRLVTLGRIALETTEFRNHAAEAMEHLAKQVGDAVHLGALERHQIVILAAYPASRRDGEECRPIGMRLPVHCSALGKVALAYRPWHEVHRTVETSGMPAWTSHTITDTEIFERELEAVRRRSYAANREEYATTWCAMAAPIRDQTGTVVAALSLSVPAHRFDEGVKRYGASLLGATRSISENLGYFPTIGAKWQRAYSA